MNRLDEMRIYVRVAEMHSFTKAADSLGIPKATVSNAIKQLESALGTRLLHRTTRTVQMTQDGMAFYERSRDMLAELDELQTLFQQGDAEISGRLRIDMPSGIAKNIVIPKLPEFLHAHPRVDIEISSTDRRVDVISEGFDCVIRVGTLADASLIARPLGHVRLLNCASPAYLKRHGLPRTLDDLAGHHLVHYVPVLGARSSGFEYVDDRQVRSVAMAGSVTVNNSDAYQAACLAGFGIIQAPAIGMADLIVQGKLVEVLEAYRAAPMPVSLIYANRRHIAKRVQRFMHWIADIMQPYLAEGARL